VLLIFVESLMELRFSVMFCELGYAIMVAKWSSGLALKK
jgi:hypothetical protein